jgi:hypothetical protein
VARPWAPLVPPERLAVLRVLMAAYALRYVHVRRGMFQRVAAADPALFEPVGLARPLARPLSPAAFRAALDAAEVANVAFLLGWRHPVTGPAFGVSLLALLSYRNSWSMIYHTDNLLALHVLVLGVAPSADALSVDAWRRSRCSTRRRKRRGAAGRYGWPIQLMNAVTTSTYMLAAIAKLKGPLGRRWATGESLRAQIAADAIRKEALGERGAPAAYRLYGQRRLFGALAAGSLVLEGLAPLALAHPRLGRIWALNALAMHWGIFVLMRIKFRYQMCGLAFAPFFPVERVMSA